MIVQNFQKNVLDGHAEASVSLVQRPLFVYKYIR